MLATRPWVENHWCLILWKLAGMVALDPESESNSSKKRWCWDEVMRQLLYRYERELNGGIRPPLRLVVTQDAPAAYPMILCISNVIWSNAGLTDDGLPIESYPELEVTDGWYRLRAQVDAPLARAIRKRVIKIGRKIGVAGARLSSERKDPSEILEAYNSTKLILSGNSSHLVPWHAKLGFKPGPCISTLHSLTSDGGVIACMDLVVVKTYPVAFFEFSEGKNGQKNREGPRNSQEEARLEEQWKRRREIEASKIRSAFEKKQARYEGYIERLERRVGTHFNPDEEATIDNFYDELEDPAGAGAVLAGIRPNEAGWLARHIHQQIQKEQEHLEEEITTELKVCSFHYLLSICPPRDIRSFRILVVQDTCTRRRPANRRAQLTVWDALNLNFFEGREGGAFDIGQRFLVTNLIPTQQRAWMDNEPGSDVYMCTRRDSRWTYMSS
ncbi:hypothetical protein BDZ94DRAFT_1286396 [Collybia nuda]|uniref:BRCA2 OB1 domain-containing protein n=1 Tax=Collybia nuda TaxID=64659 RepID=A0A9P6CQ33_9AGAR|nr:hypothetical protein BDZ94DRAFT_1286396 [Collybia nuda]